MTTTSGGGGTSSNIVAWPGTGSELATLGVTRGAAGCHNYSLISVWVLYSAQYFYNCMIVLWSGE